MLVIKSHSASFISPYQRLDTSRFSLGYVAGIHSPILSSFIYSDDTG